MAQHLDMIYFVNHSYCVYYVKWCFVILTICMYSCECMGYVLTLLNYLLMRLELVDYFLFFLNLTQYNDAIHQCCVLSSKICYQPLLLEHINSLEDFPNHIKLIILPLYTILFVDYKEKYKYIKSLLKIDLFNFITFFT